MASFLVYELALAQQWYPNHRCDGVTACDKKTAKKRFTRTLIKKLIGFAVTRCHTVTRRPLIVLRGPETNSEPNANLLGVAPAIGSYAIPFPAQFLQAFIEGIFGQRVFVACRLGPGCVGRVQIGDREPAPIPRLKAFCCNFNWDWIILSGPRRHGRHRNRRGN